MKKIILLFVWTLLSLNIQAQEATFTWSDLSDNTNVGLLNPTLVFPSPSGFSAYSVEKSGSRVFAPEIVYITKFNANGEVQEALDFALPKRQLKDATLLKVIEGGSKLYVFSFIAVKKDKKNVLYAQVYDNVTGTVSDIKEIYTLPIEKVNNSGFFEVEISEDKKTLAVLVNKLFVKKTKEQIEVLTLDSDLNIVSNASHTLSFDSKRAYREELSVNNAGVVTIIKKTNIFKKSPITSIITLKGDALEEQQASADKFYISDNKVVTIGSKQYLLGFATDNVKPAVSMGGAKDKSFFMYNISDKTLIKNQSWNSDILKKVLGKGFIDLKVKDVLVSGDDVYLIGDRFSETSEMIEGKNFEYNYTYSFGPGVVIKLNTEGEVSGVSYYKYGETYKNRGKRLGSFKPLILNNELHLFGNEKVSVLEEKKIVFGWDNINAKAMVIRKLESDGSFSTKAYKSEKVGGKRSVLDYVPTKTIQLNEKTFYVYGFGNKYHVFGKMVLD